MEEQQWVYIDCFFIIVCPFLLLHTAATSNTGYPETGKAAIVARCSIQDGGLSSQCQNQAIGIEANEFTNKASYT